MVSPERLRLQLEQLGDLIREQNRLVLLDLEPSEQEKEDLLLLLGTIKSGIERLPAAKAAHIAKQFRSHLEDVDEMSINSAQFEPVLESKAPISVATEPLTERDINGMRKSVRFSDVNEEFEASSQRYRDDDETLPLQPTPTQTTTQICQENHELIRDQDRRLETLSQSVRRQRDLGIDINTELDDQLGLLDDVEAQVDRSGSRLDNARRRVETFNKKAREQGSCLVISCLLLILFILLVVL